MKYNASNVENIYSAMMAPDVHAAYLEFLEHLSSGDYSFRTEPFDTGENGYNLELILNAIGYGFPELLVIGNQPAAATARGGYMDIEAVERYPEKDLKSMYKAIEEEAEPLVEYLHGLPGVFDILCALNEYICKNVRTNARRDLPDGDIYGFFVNHEARCEGICKGAKYILDKLGIRNQILVGTTNDDDRIDHCWSIVWMDDVPYMFDFTWNTANSVAGVPCMLFMFMDSETESKCHQHTYPGYPVCPDNSLETWNRCKGNVEYFSDLGNVEIYQSGDNYWAVARFYEGLPEDLEECRAEASKWAADELHGYDYGEEIATSVHQMIDAIQFFFINEDESEYPDEDCP